MKLVLYHKYQARKCRRRYKRKIKVWAVRAVKRKQRGFDNPSLEQARSREDWPLWEQAISKEYQQMIDDGVFVPCKGKPPPDSNLSAL
jgi:hypothetical protein